MRQPRRVVVGGACARRGVVGLGRRRLGRSLGLQASPLKNGNAGFNAAWVRGDLAELLWSGAYGALLLGVGLLTMAILRRERALSGSL